MRARTRNFVLAVLAVVVLLLAVVAVSGLLKSGDPYYVTATPTGDWNATSDTPAGTNQTAINVSALSERRFPYTTGAVAAASANASGRSEPYWTGYIGLKESFSHSPFDEREALARRNASAATDAGIYVHDGDTVYLLTVTQNPD